MSLDTRNWSQIRPARLRGFGHGLAFALLMLILALVMAFVFWPIGVILLLVALAAPFSGLSAKAAPCPNCGCDITVSSSTTKCPDCKRQLVVRGDRLIDVT